MAKRRLPALAAEDQALWDALKQDIRPLHQVPTPGGSTGPDLAPIPSAPKAQRSSRPKPMPMVWHAPGIFAKAAASPRTPGLSGSQPSDLRQGGSRGLDRAGAQRLRRGKMPIEATLDLHGLTQAQAQGQLEAFVMGAATAGKRHLLVITGKGRTSGGEGVLRTRVPEWLGQEPLGRLVLAFAYAKRHDGDQGALYLLLRRRHG